MKDMNSLSHTSWNCKYHVVFAPKYRRKAFYGNRRLEIGKILRKLCEWKGVNIIEAEVCVDHVHMLLVSRILRRHCWKKCKENRRIHQESIEGR